MGKRSVRDGLVIPVKAYLDSDMYLEFERACREVRAAHSRILRDLLIEWVQKHLKAKTLPAEMPNVGLVWAHQTASRRVNYGTAPVHLRL